MTDIPIVRGFRKELAEMPMNREIEFSIEVTPSIPWMAATSPRASVMVVYLTYLSRKTAASSNLAFSIVSEFKAYFSIDLIFFLDLLISEDCSFIHYQMVIAL